MEEVAGDRAVAASLRLELQTAVHEAENREAERLRKEQEERERQELERRLAEVIASADAMFLAGERDQAIELLWTFTPESEPIALRLKALISEKRRIDKEALRAADERRRQEEAERRRLEAERAREAAAAAEAAELQRIEEQRRIDAERMSARVAEFDAAVDEARRAERFADAFDLIARAKGELPREALATARMATMVALREALGLFPLRMSNGPGFLRRRRRAPRSADSLHWPRRPCWSWQWPWARVRVGEASAVNTRPRGYR